MKYNADIYSVTRKDGSTVLTSIFFDEGTNSFRFVNLTRKHICPCKFISLEEALMDLELKKTMELVIKYQLIQLKLLI